MEALAAVGLAGNIVQFIDFSCQLFDRTQAICRSKNGASQGMQDLETITESLQNLSDGLQKSLDRGNRGGNTATRRDENALDTLAKGCQDVATELISVLQGVKAKETGSTWSSFRASLASMRKEKQINAIEKLLDTYRSQLIIQLQVLQR